MRGDFDRDEAVAAWRGQLAREETFGADDLDELESHLHDELDALAEVGVEDPDAFAHATRQLGATEALALEYERAKPGAAWRLPTLFVLAGVLLAIFVPVVQGVVKAVLLFAAIKLHASEALGYVGIAFVNVVLPLAFLAIAARYAPAFVATVRSTTSSRGWFGAARRIAFLVATGVVVLLAGSGELSIKLYSYDRQELTDWMQWHRLEAPVARLVWPVLPFVLVAVACFARRRAARGDAAARFTCWAVLGWLGADLVLAPIIGATVLRLRSRLSEARLVE